MKNLLVLCFLLSFTFAMAIVQETGSFTDFVYGHNSSTAYDNWASHISEGVARPGYNAYADYDPQTEGFGAYHVPTETELANWRLVMRNFARGNVQQAESQINQFGFPYEVVEFVDTDDQRIYYIMRELLNMDYTDDNGTEWTGDDEVGSFDYGWGLYVYDRLATKPILVSAPHPNDDYISLPLSVRCFTDWDARYLLVNGTGREVHWTHSGSYNNSKALSDPSRNVLHPMQIAYEEFVDATRAALGMHEFSAQLHSYDWSSHPGFGMTQISAGNHINEVQMPLKDDSSLRLDMFNQTPYVVLPPNTVGLHDTLTVEDYYAVYGEPQTYVKADGSIIDVPSNVDLPGYSYNRQMFYSYEGYNEYDLREAFFHIEVDELPNCYDQTEANLKWFYGYDFANERYPVEGRFDYPMAFWQPWITAMANALNAVYPADDELPVPTPVISIADNGTNSVGISWDPLDCFDFYSYEVLWANEPLTDSNYTVLNREQIPELAMATTSGASVSGLSMNQEYYFKVRAVDYAGNVSELSNQVSASTGAASIAWLKAIGNDGQVDISFYVPQQINNTGFIIKRAADVDGPYQDISDYTANNELISFSGEHTYYYTDTEIANGNDYYYKVASVDNNNLTQVYSTTAIATPRKVFLLVAQSSSSTAADTLRFGANPSADNMYDELYDVPCSDDLTQSDFVYAGFLQEDWPEYQTFKQLMHNDFDPQTGLRPFNVTFRSDSGPIEVSLLNPSRDSEKFILQIGDEYIDLTTQTATIATSVTAYTNAILWWGNLQPTIRTTGSGSRILPPGTPVEFVWESEHAPIITGIDIKVKSETEEWQVAQNLPGTTTTYTWNPPTIEADSLTMSMYVHLIGGDNITVNSSEVIAFRSNVHAYNTQPGWQLVADPDASAAYDTQSIWGANSQLWLPDGDNWIQSNTTAFGPAWVYTQAANQQQQTIDFAQFPYDMPLHQGWNIVANPHPLTYDLSQLLFVGGAQNMTWWNAIDLGIVNSNVYAYCDTLKQISSLTMGQAAMIWCNSSNATLRFAPFQPITTGTPAIPAQFSIRLKAQMEESNQDYVNFIAHPNGNSNYIMANDYIKPPVGPFYPRVELSIVQINGADSLFLQQKLIPDFPDNNTNYIAKVMLHVEPAGQPVTFTFDPQTMPDGYQTALIHDSNQGTFFLPQLTYTYTPQTTNTVLAFHIRNWYTVDTNDITPPAKLSLSNMPNPFNPQTTISYNLPQTGQVQLKIYNLKGQCVKTLVNQRQQQGSHSLTWYGDDHTGRSLGSGIYFCRIKTPGKTLVRKLMLLK